MEYIILKNSDLKVSRICMGGCPLGQYGWGAVEEQELLRTVQAALDAGITFSTRQTPMVLALRRELWPRL